MERATFLFLSISTYTHSAPTPLQMPVHTIPTTDGRTIHWYESNACVAVGGKLLCVRSNTDDARKVLLIAVEKNLTALPLTWPSISPQWPHPHYMKVFNFQHTHDDQPHWLSSCFFVAERAAFTRTKTSSDTPCIDVINPAFRRLQRWFRKCSARLRAQWQERALAFATGSVCEKSHVQSLPSDIVELILLQNTKSANKK